MSRAVDSVVEVVQGAAAGAVAGAVLGGVSTVAEKVGIAKPEQTGEERTPGAQTSSASTGKENDSPESNESSNAVSG